MPLAEAVVMHDCPFGPSTVTEASGVAVPETVGVLVAVPLLAGLTIATVGGATADTVTGTLVLPAEFVAVTVRVVGPTGTVTGQANVPEMLAVVVQSVTGPGPVITITLPGVAVPLMTGAVVPVGGVAAVRLGKPITLNALNTGCEVPPGFEAVACTTLAPVAKVMLLQDQLPPAVAVTEQVWPFGP